MINRSMPASMVLARAEILRLRAEVARLQALLDLSNREIQRGQRLKDARLRAHEFHEDVNDASMCICGIPAITHDRAMAPQTPQEPREGTTSTPDAVRRPERHPDTWADRQNEPPT
jgi:hypothetical protein